LIASATLSHLRLLSLPEIGSTIDPDWSIRKIKQLGLTRLISAEYGIALLVLLHDYGY
jgi:hypothetical protein